MTTGSLSALTVFTLLMFTTLRIPMIRDMEVTVSQSEFVPQWAKSIVWYQIFPERFRNGDPTNDPTVSDILGADPPDPPKAWHIHPWGSDWYELKDYEKANNESELWKHLVRRRYGGDLQGIIDKLDYLKDLGITGIYLTPVFDAPSLHKYDGACYHHIDPTFGPDPKGDRALMQQEVFHDPATWVWTAADELALTLIKAAHDRGMKIIFDGVFNHMGVNSPAFRDLVKNQQRSAYKDWFVVNSWNDPAGGTTFDYEGWYGVRSLPELREDERGIVAGPRAYIFAAAERWMNPKGMGTRDGIDGWRLDVAYCISHPFWKAWRTHVKAINPDALVIAELVLPLEKVTPYMQGDEFDGEMNYNFAMTCAEFFFNPPPSHIPPTEFAGKLHELRTAFPPGVAEVSQNLFGSHDAARMASYIVNRGAGSYRDWEKYFFLSKAADNPRYAVRKPTREERQLQMLFVIFQMTYSGAPMIYYGDEVGMWGANDPDCRKPMLWDDIEFAPETYNPDGSTRTPDPVVIDHELLAHYRKLIGIRNASRALQTGDVTTRIADDRNNVFAFSRRLQNEEVLVVLNNSSGASHVAVPITTEGSWIDLLNGASYAFVKGPNHITVPPYWGVILKSASGSH